MCMYGAFYSFANNANDFLSRIYDMNTITAGRYMLCVYLPAAVLTPVFGYLADKTCC